MTGRLISYHTAMVHTACSSASSTSASIWSDTPFQSCNSSNSNFTPCCIGHPATKFAAAALPSWQEQKLPIEPAFEQRHRRISARTEILNSCPRLVRQSDRKIKFVEGLVDSSVQIVEAIWPLSSVACRCEMGNKGVVPLHTFIQKTLCRSRTSYSTLQVALYYLILIKPYAPSQGFTIEQPDDLPAVRALQCGRRMFLSALILASKYLQDRNYSTRAWSKICRLSIMEINQNEIAFLQAIDWKLHVTDTVFERWTDIVLTYTPSQPPSLAAFCPKLAKQKADWKAIILMLSSDLDNIKEFSVPASANPNVQLTVPSPQPFNSLTVERVPPVDYRSTESIPGPKDYTEQPLPNTYPSKKSTPVLSLLPTP